MPARAASRCVVSRRAARSFGHRDARRVQLCGAAGAWSVRRRAQRAAAAPQTSLPSRLAHAASPPLFASRRQSQQPTCLERVSGRAEEGPFGELPRSRPLARPLLAQWPSPAPARPSPAPWSIAGAKGLSGKVCRACRSPAAAQLVWCSKHTASTVQLGGAARRLGGRGGGLRGVASRASADVVPPTAADS